MSSSGSLYRYANTYDGAGDVLTVSDSVMGLMNFTGGYDALHRLTGGSFISGPYAGQYGCWKYDSFGNRTAEAVSTTPCSSSPSPSSWAAYASGTNRITSGSSTFNYSAAGNVKYDGLNTYLYDNEGRVCAVQNGATSVYQYLYDAMGNRIAKASANSPSCSPSARTGLVTQYLLGPGGEDVTELNGSNAWNYSNIYASGRLLGTYSGSNTYFSMNDWLGTKRAEATANGSNCGTYSSLPFGNGLTPSGSCDPSEQHFTGKERDAESGLDYFGARYYGSSMGRFMSPDPGNAGAHRTNPESWNMYSYANNRPLSLLDSNGLEPVKAQAGTIAGFANKLNNTTHKIGQLTGTAAQNALKSLGDTHNLLPTNTGTFNMDPNRYVYTGNDGWVDMVHFMFYAGKAATYKADGAANPVGKAVQDGYHQEFYDQFRDSWSAYSYEDLPSDLLGAIFGSDFFDPTSSMTLAEQVQAFFAGLTPLPTASAPNYSQLPQNDSKDPPMARNKTTNGMFTILLTPPHEKVTVTIHY